MILEYQSGNFNVTEPKVVELVTKYPMTYSTDYSTIVAGSTCIILVNTPTCLAGYDHSWLEESLANSRDKGQACTIITSTVQPGFCDRQTIPDLIYNPLFVQIGNVIENLESVTDVLVGTSGALSNFWENVFGTGVKIHSMSFRAAEVAKLGLNSYVTTKISFANMIGDALRTSGSSLGDIDACLNFIGSDSRINNKCFKYGWGFGGPCFPRDNRALSTFLREVGSYDYIPMASHESNERHAVEQAKNYTDDTMTGMCYKDNCSVPIIEESHKVKTALILKSMGRSVKIVDTPEIMEQLPSYLKS